MARYKVLNKFKDLQENETYEVGQEIEMTVKRADEVVENLSKHNKKFLERIDDKKEGDKEEEGK